MTFRSISEFETAINNSLATATTLMEEKIKSVVEAYIQQFYSEWTPGETVNNGNKFVNNYGYQRTFQLIKSLITTSVKKTGNGFEAEVYLDFDKMNHDMNFVNGRWIKHNHWDENTIGSVAASSDDSHGGWKSGTKIWDDPMKVLNRRKRSILKKMLRDAGIPVK